MNDHNLALMHIFAPYFRFTAILVLENTNHLSFLLFEMCDRTCLCNKEIEWNLFTCIGKGSLARYVSVVSLKFWIVGIVPGSREKFNKRGFICRGITGDFFIFDYMGIRVTRMTYCGTDIDTL